MFHLLAAFAEFERELTQDRAKAGLGNVWAKAKRLEPPRKVVDHDTVLALRGYRLGLRAIAKTIGVSMSVVRRALERRSG